MTPVRVTRLGAATLDLESSTLPLDHCVPYIGLVYNINRYYGLLVENFKSLVAENDGYESKKGRYCDISSGLEVTIHFSCSTQLSMNLSY